MHTPDDTNAVANKSNKQNDDPSYREKCREDYPLEEFGFFSPVTEIDTNNKGKAFVVQYQKVAILTQNEIKDLEEKKEIQVKFREKSATARLVRKSDCPNPAGEYGKETTYMVLLQIEEQGVTVREVVERFSNWAGAGADTSQSNNFVLSDMEPSGSLPSPPVQAGGPTELVLPSDFQIVSPEDFANYNAVRSDNGKDKTATAVVAVVDSGVKFNLKKSPKRLYEYKDHKKEDRKFRLATGLKTDCNIQENAIGYCGVTEYINYKDSVATGGARIPELAKLLSRGFTPEKICSSAFDDNRVKNKKEKPGGRHGTHVTALVNQNSGDGVFVLPVKAFNCGAYGTLFDVLCCLNFVLAQKNEGLPITVLNASWVGKLDTDGEKLLRSKFKELQKVGILVVAAAGNQQRDLNDPMLYPACYSADNEIKNVITITSVERVYTFIPHLEGDHDAKDELTSSEKETVLAEPDQFRVIPGDYKVSTNYSKKFVSLGVYGGGVLWTGLKNPFSFGNKASEPIQGSSFSAAVVSGIIAQKLLDDGITPTGGNVGNIKNDIVREITEEESSLMPTIKEGRLLKNELMNHMI